MFILKPVESPSAPLLLKFIRIKMIRFWWWSNGTQRYFEKTNVSLFTSASASAFYLKQCLDWRVSESSQVICYKIRLSRKSDKFHGSVLFKMSLQPLKIPLVERFIWMSHWYNEFNAAAFEELQMLYEQPSDLLYWARI